MNLPIEKLNRVVRFLLIGVAAILTLMMWKAMKLLYFALKGDGIP